MYVTTRSCKAEEHFEVYLESERQSLYLPTTVKWHMSTGAFQRRGEEGDHVAAEHWAQIMFNRVPVLSDWSVAPTPGWSQADVLKRSLSQAKLINPQRHVVRCRPRASSCHVSVPTHLG